MPSVSAAVSSVLTLSVVLVKSCKQFLQVVQAGGILYSELTKKKKKAE